MQEPNTLLTPEETDYVIELGRASLQAPLREEIEAAISIRRLGRLDKKIPVLLGTAAHVLMTSRDAVRVLIDSGRIKAKLVTNHDGHRRWELGVETLAAFLPTWYRKRAAFYEKRRRAIADALALKVTGRR